MFFYLLWANLLAFWGLASHPVYYKRDRGPGTQGHKTYRRTGLLGTLTRRNTIFIFGLSIYGF